MSWCDPLKLVIYYYSVFIAVMINNSCQWLSRKNRELLFSLSERENTVVRGGRVGTALIWTTYFQVLPLSAERYYLACVDRADLKLSIALTPMPHPFLWWHLCLCAITIAKYCLLLLNCLLFSWFLPLWELHFLLSLLPPPAPLLLWRIIPHLLN